MHSACWRGAMRGRAVAVAALVVALGFGGAPRPAVAAEPPSPEPAAIGALLDEFIDALNTADLPRYVALFAPDATAFFPLAEVPLRLESKEQIAAVFGRFFEGVRRSGPGPRYLNLAPADVRLQLYGGAAVVSFHFKGGEMTSRRTLVLAKRDGKWSIVHLHASNLGLAASR